MNEILWFLDAAIMRHVVQEDQRNTLLDTISTEIMPPYKEIDGAIIIDNECKQNLKESFEKAKENILVIQQS
jgi:hypothetical protein